MASQHSERPARDVLARACWPVVLLARSPRRRRSGRNRTIRVVVPYPAGGPADFMGPDGCAEIAGKASARPVVVEKQVRRQRHHRGPKLVRQSPAGRIHPFLAAPSVHVLGRQGREGRALRPPSATSRRLPVTGEGPLVRGWPIRLPWKARPSPRHYRRSAGSRLIFVSGCRRWAPPTILAVLEFNNRLDPSQSADHSLPRIRRRR